MGRYDDLYKKSVKKGNLKGISTRLIKDHKEGEKLIGRLIAITKVSPEGTDESGKEKKPYYNYHLETDIETIKFSCGAVVDSDVQPLLVIGEIYAFIYEGKQEIGNGRTMNSWNIQKLTEVPGE